MRDQLQGLVIIKSRKTKNTGCDILKYFLMALNSGVIVENGVEKRVISAKPEGIYTQESWCKNSLSYFSIGIEPEALKEWVPIHLRSEVRFL